MSDSTPTPRLTGQWAFWRDAAAGLVDDLNRLELTVSKDLSTYDRQRGEEIRATARLASCYARRFARWQEADVDIAQKQREQDEFRDLSRFAMRLLGRVPAGP